MLDPQQTVAQTVLDHSECAAVFVKNRIDFCCRGELSIADAAAGRGVALAGLLGELQEAIAQRNPVATKDPRNLTTDELLDHIVVRHHDYLRQALPFVEALAAKVNRVHGGHNSKLVALDRAVHELAAALLPHLDNEEEALFPTLRDSGAKAAPELMRRLFRAMHEEHLTVSRLLEEIRAAADDFTLPGWACNSYRTLFAELRRLEADLFSHVHLENHVLRPRFGA